MYSYCIVPDELSSDWHVDFDHLINNMVPARFLHCSVLSPINNMFVQEGTLELCKYSVLQHTFG